MEQHQNPSARRLKEFETSFDSTIKEVERLFGKHAFQRPEGDGWREQALAGLYDAEMIAVSELSDRIAVLPELSGQAIVRKLYKQNSFENAVKSGTNTPSRVRLRVSALKNELEKAIEG